MKANTKTHSGENKAIFLWSFLPCFISIRGLLLAHQRWLCCDLSQRSVCLAPPKASPHRRRRSVWGFGKGQQNGRWSRRPTWRERCEQVSGRKTLPLGTGGAETNCNLHPKPTFPQNFPSPLTEGDRLDPSRPPRHQQPAIGRSRPTPAAWPPLGQRGNKSWCFQQQCYLKLTVLESKWSSAIWSSNNIPQVTHVLEQHTNNMAEKSGKDTKMKICLGSDVTVPVQHHPDHRAVSQRGYSVPHNCQQRKIQLIYIENKGEGMSLWPNIRSNTTDVFDICNSRKNVICGKMTRYLLNFYFNCQVFSW